MSKRVDFEKITQSKNGLNAQFIFYNDHLKYEARGGDGDISFIVAYQNLTANKRTIRVRKQIFLLASIAFWALGGASAFTDVFDNQIPYAGLCLLLIAVVLTCVYFFKQFNITVLPSARGQLSILHDKQHDKILDRLMAKRKSTLLRQFQHTNYSGKPQIRAQALQWLMENEVISETEYRAMLKEAPASKSQHISVDLKNNNRGLH